MSHPVKSEFLRQSYRDSEADYLTSLNDTRAPAWDWVVITASNELQAESCRLRLRERHEKGMLPRLTHFDVISDEAGKRIGSGGATLGALKLIRDSDPRPFGEMKICIIHSGGDSSRIPQYSAIGKLFTPVPRMLPSGDISSLFDEILISISGVPARMPSGVFVAPGDTLLLFNPLQLDFELADAIGISVKTDISIGKEHGVFTEDSCGKVVRFLHKQSEATLRTEGAVDSNARVNVDTGMIWLSSETTEKLFSLICCDGRVDGSLFEQFVSPRVRLSFYADFLFPMAKDSSLDEYYLQIPEKEFSGELKACRREIWDKLHGCELSLIKLDPAGYIHFGTTRELFDLFTENFDSVPELGWERRNACSDGISANARAMIFNSYVEKSAVLGRCFIEDCEITGASRVGDNTVLSGITAHAVQIPDGAAFHCLKLKNGKYVCRTYGIDDNAKSSVDSVFLGSSIRRALRKYGISRISVGHINAPASIWTIELFPECDSRESALSSALTLHKIFSETASLDEIDAWLSSNRHSLESSFNEADVPAVLSRREYIADTIKAYNFINLINSGEPLSSIKTSLCPISDETAKMLFKTAETSTFPLNMRLYSALSSIVRTGNAKTFESCADKLEESAHDSVKTVILRADSEKFPRISPAFPPDSKKAEYTMSVRINFCGSPSDNAPYCIEHGATMLNCALSLNGQNPVSAYAESLDDDLFIFENADFGIKKSFASIDEIFAESGFGDALSVHKAVFRVIFKHERPCGGLYLSTRANVPKGSGLGIENIITAACVKAVFALLGKEVSDDLVYSKVFAAARITGTGSGWQDQVGALTPGLKYLRSSPGAYQKIELESVALSPEAREELRHRFILIHSGQRRLSRNILREQANLFMQNDTIALEATERVRQLCALMKFELERGNVTGFAKRVTEQFELMKTIDRGASNPFIEYVFSVCNGLVDGGSVCGTGGGGFLYMILKEGLSPSDFRKKANALFEGSGGVKIWDAELLI